MGYDFEISTDKEKLQIDRIHAFLSKKAYWCEGIPRSVIEKAIANSVCFGVYEKRNDVQVGFARLLTDGATFAWIADVYVEEEYRGQGLSKLLMESVMTHSSLQALRRICLTTKDAHSLYQKFGFAVTETPGNWMEIKNNQIYKILKPKVKNR